MSYVLDAKETKKVTCEMFGNSRHLKKSFIAKFTFQNDLTPKIIHSAHLLSHGPIAGIWTHVCFTTLPADQYERVSAWLLHETSNVFHKEETFVHT